MMRHWIEARFALVRAPTLVVWGERDSVGQPRNEGVVRLQLPGRLRVMPRAAHAVGYSVAETFARLRVALLDDPFATLPDRIEAEVEAWT